MAIFAKRRRRKLPLVLSVLIIILAAAYLIMDYMGYSISDLFAPEREPVDGQITVHIIDVGQGDSILIETPEGFMLIDAGTNSSEDDLQKYLDDLGVHELEYFVVTHAHDDHYGGADMIIEEYEIKNLIYDDFGYNEKTLTMFKNSGANIIDPEVRDEYFMGDAKFTVLSSDIADTRTDKNDHSIVLRLDYGLSSFVFTGDATTYTENRIMEEFPVYELECDFLKSGHHGSLTSSGEQFLKALQPEIIAISCGLNNKYGLPKQEILDRYVDIDAKYYRTDYAGDLVYVSDGETITYQGN